jgi:hypothetical protein
MIDKILKNPQTEGFFSFLIGVGLMVMFFHRPIKSSRGLALEPSKFENREIKADGKCYMYRVEDASCEIAPFK